MSDDSSRRFPLVRAFRRGSFDPYAWDGFFEFEEEEKGPPLPTFPPPRPLSSRERVLYPALMAVGPLPLVLIFVVVALAHTALVAN